MMLRPLARAAVRGSGVLVRARSKAARPQPLEAGLFRSKCGRVEQGASSASRRSFSMISDMGSKDWRSRGDLQPAPRQLSEVVKLPLLKREDSSTVRHLSRELTLGGTCEVYLCHVVAVCRDGPAHVRVLF